MANAGPDLMGSLDGAYNAVPPPGAMVRVNDDSAGMDQIAGFSLRKMARRAGRGLKRAGSMAVKVHTAPFKFAAKYGQKALKALAKTAALPIRNMFRKLGMRRARYLAWHHRKSTAPNAAERSQASAWTVAKMRRNPMGRFGVFILQHTHGHSVSGASIAGAIREATEAREPGTVGITGAEIAAAAATIIGVIKMLMGQLDKPGEAPANAQAAEPAAPTANPADAPQADPVATATEPATPVDTSGGMLGYAWQSFRAEMHKRRAGAKRYVTIHEAKHAAKLWRAKHPGKTMQQAEAHVLVKLHQNGVAVVHDQSQLPKKERAFRRFGSAPSLTGAERGKKAYRRRARSADDVPAGEPSADDILKQAERYGGYASKKEWARARRAGATMGDCSGNCDIAGCCNKAAGSDDSAGNGVWDFLKSFNRGRAGRPSGRRHFVNRF
jgi:hypothetical protein